MSGEIAFTVVFGVMSTFVVGGFALMFSELRRLETKFETSINGLRKDLAEEFRTQRTEVLAQTTALANVIVATRRG